MTDKEERTREKKEKRGEKDIVLGSGETAIEVR
jgi:hypothetical protein